MVDHKSRQFIHSF